MWLASTKASKCGLLQLRLVSGRASTKANKCGLLLLRPVIVGCFY